MTGHLQTFFKLYVLKTFMTIKTIRKKVVFYIYENMLKIIAASYEYCFVKCKMGGIRHSLPAQIIPVCQGQGII